MSGKFYIQSPNNTYAIVSKNGGVSFTENWENASNFTKNEVKKYRKKYSQLRNCTRIAKEKLPKEKIPVSEHGYLLEKGGMYIYLDPDDKYKPKFFANKKTVFPTVKAAEDARTKRKKPETISIIPYNPPKLPSPRPVVSEVKEKKPTVLTEKQAEVKTEEEKIWEELKHYRVAILSFGDTIAKLKKDTEEQVKWDQAYKEIAGYQWEMVRLLQKDVKELKEETRKLKEEIEELKEKIPKEETKDHSISCDNDPLDLGRLNRHNSLDPDAEIRAIFGIGPTQQETKIHPRKPFSVEERYQVYKNSEGKCRICGKKLSQEEFTVDHIVPLAKGGSNELSNLQCACRSCNSFKADMSEEELLKKIDKISHNLHSKFAEKFLSKDEDLFPNT